MNWNNHLSYLYCSWKTCKRSYHRFFPSFFWFLGTEFFLASTGDGESLGRSPQKILNFRKSLLMGEFGGAEVKVWKKVAQSFPQAYASLPAARWWNFWLLSHCSLGFIERWWSEEFARKVKGSFFVNCSSEATHHNVITTRRWETLC